MRDTHRLKEKYELTLDNHQIVVLTVVLLILVGGAFALGINVGKKLAADQPAVAAAAPPADILAAAGEIAFRNLVLCALRLRTDRFSDNASLYFPDPDVPFTRLYESKNRSASMAPSGETCVVLEIPCDPGDATWRAPDAKIISTCVHALARATGFDPDLVVEASVHRAGHAYPVLQRGAATRVAEMLGYCARFGNLRLAGRNALFRYAHLHDMLRQGRDAVNALENRPIF